MYAIMFNTQTCKVMKLPQPAHFVYFLNFVLTFFHTLQNKSFDMARILTGAPIVLPSLTASWLTSSQRVHRLVFTHSKWATEKKHLLLSIIYLFFHRDPYIVLFLIPTSLDSMSSPIYSNQPRSSFSLLSCRPKTKRSESLKNSDGTNGPKT